MDEINTRTTTITITPIFRKKSNYEDDIRKSVSSLDKYIKELRKEYRGIGTYPIQWSKMDEEMARLKKLLRI